MRAVLGHHDWLAGAVPDDVRAHIRQLVEIVGYLPHDQPFAVISGDAVLLAANRSLLDLLEVDGDDLLEADWGDVMPSWRSHLHGLDGREAPRTRAFDEYLRSGSGDGKHVHVVARPVFARGDDGGEREGAALAAWALFMSRREAPDQAGELQRRLELESMLAGVSARLVDSSSATASEAVAFTLRQLGVTTEADSCGLYQLAADQATVDWARLWGRSRDRVRDTSDIEDLKDLPWLRTRLTAGEVVEVCAAGGLPEEAAAERELWEVLGTGPTVVAPLLHRSVLVGFLRLSKVELGQPWAGEDVSLVRLLANLLTRFFVDRRDEDGIAAVSRCAVEFGADVDHNLGSICRVAGEVLGAAFVVYQRRRGDRLESVTGWRLPHDLPDLAPAEGQVANNVISAGTDVVLVEHLQDTLYAYSDPHVQAFGCGAFVGYPVTAAGRTIASLGAHFREGVQLRPMQTELFRMLGRAACGEEDRRLAQQRAG